MSINVYYNFFPTKFKIKQGIIPKEKYVMENLLITIGELVATEIDEVESVKYVDKEMGYMFYINLDGGKKILLSLIDSDINP